MPGLRPLQDADIALIRDWPPYGGDMAQMDYALRESGWLEEFCSKPGVRAYVVEDGAELTAFTILTKTGTAEAEFRIALRADRTGLGLGESITVQTLRIGFEQLQLSRVHLIVRKNNHRGIRLYLRVGFEEEGECWKEIGGVPVDFLVMGICCEKFDRVYRTRAGQSAEREGL